MCVCIGQVVIYKGNMETHEGAGPRGAIRLNLLFPGRALGRDPVSLG